MYHTTTNGVTLCTASRQTVQRTWTGVGCHYNHSMLCSKLLKTRLWDKVLLCACQTCVKHTNAHITYQPKHVLWSLFQCCVAVSPSKHLAYKNPLSITILFPSNKVNLTTTFAQHKLTKARNETKTKVYHHMFGGRHQLPHHTSWR